MARRLAAAAVCVLAGGLAWAGGQQPPRPVEPPPKPVAGPATARQLQDDVELLEAQLATKQAYVKLAESPLSSLEKRLEAAKTALDRGSGSYADYFAVKAERDAAAAMVEVRKAEMNEVAVLLKHARRRLEDAGGKGAAPGPGREEKPAEKPAADLAELKAAALKAEARLKGAQARVEKAKAGLTKAKADLDFIKEAIIKGVVAKEELTKSMAAMEEAEADVKVAVAGVAEAEADLALAKDRLEKAQRR